MNVLIIDDHPVFRDGFAAFLVGAKPGTVVLQAYDVAEAVRLIERTADLDVVVLDLLMPGVDGLEAIGRITRARQDLPIIVLSSSEDPRDVRRALSLGALGYVPKSSSSSCLLSAIKLVIDGNLYVPPLMLGDTADPRADAGQPPGSPLTARQVDVLRLIAAGRPNKLIAHQLNLSEKTVKVHVTAIFKALNVINRTQAAAAGREHGVI